MRTRTVIGPIKFFEVKELEFLHLDSNCINCVIECKGGFTLQQLRLGSITPPHDPQNPYEGVGKELKGTAC